MRPSHWDERTREAYIGFPTMLVNVGRLSLRCDSQHVVPHRPVDLAIPEEAVKRAGKRRQENAALAGHRSVQGWTTSVDPLHQLCVEPRSLGHIGGEVAPSDRARSGEVPDAGLAVDQKIERHVDKIGHIGRRHHVGTRRERPAGGEGIKGRPDEVVAVPRPEECARTHDQAARMRRADAPLRISLARSIDAARIYWIALYVRAAEAAIKDEV